jgi:dihydroorotate dehydrogenase electron transfer subunit
MRIHSGLVAEIRLDAGGNLAAEIHCPPGAVPAPGRYTLAALPGSILPEALFSAGITRRGFQAAPPFPADWSPGSSLQLVGPLGRGFQLPKGIKRLALLAAGESVERLLPLSTAALADGASVAMFTDAALPPLPAPVEAHPSSALPEAFRWADFLAADLPFEHLADLSGLLCLDERQLPPCPGQALVFGRVPCGGMADCGLCALPAGRGWAYVCKDGPVFDLKKLLGRER